MDVSGFKLSVGVDTLAFWPLFPKIRQNFIQLSGHTDPGQNVIKLFADS